MPQPQSIDEDAAEGKEGFAMFLAYPGDETYEDDTLKAAKEGQKHRLYIKKDRLRFTGLKLARNIEVDDVVSEAKANL